MNLKRVDPCFHLNDQEFTTLSGEDDWTINEIPIPEATKIREHFGIDTSFCVFASGDSTAVGRVGGIDWVREEDRPRPGEPALNVYHFMITEKTDLGYPVYYLGAKGTIAPHWSELDDLKAYVGEWD